MTPGRSVLGVQPLAVATSSGANLTAYFIVLDEYGSELSGRVASRAEWRSSFAAVRNAPMESGAILALLTAGWGVVIEALASLRPSSPTPTESTAKFAAADRSPIENMAALAAFGDAQAESAAEAAVGAGPELEAASGLSTRARSALEFLKSVVAAIVPQLEARGGPAARVAILAETSARFTRVLRGEQLEMVAESHLRQIVQGEFLTETVAASMVPAEFKSRLATIMTPLLEGRQGAATRLQNPAEFQAEPKSRVAVPAESGAIIAPAQTAALFDFRSGAAASTQPLAEFRQIERGRSKPPIEAQGGASRAAIVLTEFALQGPAPEPANAAVLIISDDVLVRLEVTDFN